MYSLVTTISSDKKSGKIDPWIAQWSKRGSGLMKPWCDLPTKVHEIETKNHHFRDRGDHIRLEA